MVSESKLTESMIKEYFALLFTKYLRVQWSGDKEVGWQMKPVCLLTKQAEYDPIYHTCDTYHYEIDSLV